MKQNNFQLAAKRAFAGDMANRSRADVAEIAWHLAGFLDNPNNTDEREREAAQLAFDQCNTVLLYLNDPRTTVMVPPGFWVKDFYSKLVANLVERLPLDHVECAPVYIALSKSVAELVDNQNY